MLWESVCESSTTHTMGVQQCVKVTRRLHHARIEGVFRNKSLSYRCQLPFARLGELNSGTRRDDVGRSQVLVFCTINNA